MYYGMRAFFLPGGQFKLIKCETIVNVNLCYIGNSCTGNSLTVSERFGELQALSVAHGV